MNKIGQKYNCLGKALNIHDIFCNHFYYFFEYPQDSIGQEVTFREFLSLLKHMQKLCLATFSNCMIMILMERHMDGQNLRQICLDIW